MSGRGAVFVSLGVLLTRSLGLVRVVVLSAFAGVGPLADVLTAALRAPNVLQNLLGEQALSASFIPVYSRLLAEGRREEASRLARAVFSLLLIVASLVALLGVLLAPWLVRLLLPGFANDAAAVQAGEATLDRYALVVQAVRIVFPTVAFLVLSAWCLGVLNSHRRFFLPYAAPALWNVGMIAGLLFGGGLLGVVPFAESTPLERLALAACWGGLLGGVLQFGVQLPTVYRCLGSLLPGRPGASQPLRAVLRAFPAALAGRGVAQLSGYVDLFLASLLAVGATGAIDMASRLYLLPIALFGASVAAAELPELSSRRVGGQGVQIARVTTALERSLFFIVPTVVGYLVLGYWIVGAIFRRGAFDADDQWLVYAVLATYALGMLATVVSRLLQNVFFARSDTATPARIAAVRLLISASVGFGAMSLLDRIAVPETATVGPDQLRFGAVGLAIGSVAGAWIELTLLRRAIRRAEGALPLPWSFTAKALALAAGCSVVSLAAVQALGTLTPLPQGLVVLAIFAGSYLLLAPRLGLVEHGQIVDLLRRGGRDPRDGGDAA